MTKMTAMDAFAGARRIASQGGFDPRAGALTALVYDQGFAIGDVLSAIAAESRRSGWRLGGMIERPGPKTGGKCDMLLEDLTSGETIRISEDRGALARGCRLDLDSLSRACALVLSSLSATDLILLNKFGKAESEGGGFRCIISDALALDIPVVIGVPRCNLDAWREFAGDLAVERHYSCA
ncbi:DUF2478 domain-containing protein [Rhodoblastus sp.]|jgi:nucleoside-triphosphatase THEP1|uniref:DUF2478 domain-containing protein n=1 Tax=Rhodoblastus sp. TaxID=1962975 RepID=UPI00263109DE|nr:DUF2478 domain-containing protein [Rhodoblastus sp.]